MKNIKEDVSRNFQFHRRDPSSDVGEEFSGTLAKLYVAEDENSNV